MSGQDVLGLRSMEGRKVCLALADGSRIDDADLVSFGRGQTRTVWVFANGQDVFLPITSLRAAWES